MSTDRLPSQDQTGPRPPHAWWVERLLDLQLRFEPGTLRVLEARGSGTLPGWPPEQLVGRSLPELWPEEDRDTQRARLQRREDSSGGEARFDLRFVDPQGESRTAEALLAPPSGAGSRWLGLRDVTQERAREREIEERSMAMEFTNQYITDLNRSLELSGSELERAKERLSELNESKSRFLAMAAHELRTPMTAAKTAVSLLQAGMMGPVTPQQGEVLGIIHQNVDRLVRLVNDLLDLARIEAGKVDLRYQTFEVRALLHQAADLMTSEAGRRGIGIRVEASELRWTADADRVQQVVLNLLGNAVKFTPEGGHVTLAAAPCEEGLRFEIRDSGRGIQPEELPHLFRPFERLDNEVTRKANGTGLGLSISKELVEMHGGRIWPESEPGHGTSIFFILPERPAIDSATQAA